MTLATATPGLPCGYISYILVILEKGHIPITKKHGPEGFVGFVASTTHFNSNDGSIGSMGSSNPQLPRCSTTTRQGASARGLEVGSNQGPLPRAAARKRQRDLDRSGGSNGAKMGMGAKCVVEHLNLWTILFIFGIYTAEKRVSTHIQMNMYGDGPGVGTVQVLNKCTTVPVPRSE